MSELQAPLKNALRTPRSSARVEAMWSNIQARRARRGPTSLQLAGAGVACACAVLLFAMYQGVPGTRAAISHPGELAGVVAPADAGPLRLQHGGMIAALRAQGEPLQVSFSDGSRVTLSANTELLPRGTTGRRMSFALTHGRVLLDVVPHGPRNWAIDAGEVEVSVLGTRFSVTRDASAVAVEVERGLVRVTGPRVPGGTQQLGAGQALRVPSADSGGSAIKSTGDTDDVQGGIEPAHPDVRPGGVRGKSAKAAGAAELLEQADRARLAGRPQQAAQALERLLDHYADDPSAALAALTLGRLCLDQLQAPARAAQALALANTLGLPRALAEEGAARLVEAHAKAGHIDLARAAAARYVARYPEGGHAAAVSAWAKTE